MTVCLGRYGGRGKEREGKGRREGDDGWGRVGGWREVSDMCLCRCGSCCCRSQW